MTGRRQCGRPLAAALLTLLLVLFAAPALSVPPDFTALGMALVVLVAAALLWGARVVTPARTAGHRGLDGDERQLRGAFRRQTSPDTAGRPRPRAPGTGLRPV